jgi:acyl-CoA thioester hydrolase
MIRHRLRVIYGDTDQMGVVYYANYYRYMEAARSEYIRAKGMSYREIEATGVYLPVVESHCEYRAPARYDDELIVEATVAEVRAASMRFDYRILRGDELLATGHTRHASVDKSGRPTRVPKAVAALAEPTGDAG